MNAVNQQKLALLMKQFVENYVFHMLVRNLPTFESAEMLLKYRSLYHSQEKENGLKMGTWDCSKAALKVSRRPAEWEVWSTYCSIFKRYANQLSGYTYVNLTQSGLSVLNSPSPREREDEPVPGVFAQPIHPSQDTISRILASPKGTSGHLERCWQGTPTPTPAWAGFELRLWSGAEGKVSASHTHGKSRY